MNRPHRGQLRYIKDEELRDRLDNLIAQAELNESQNRWATSRWRDETVWMFALATKLRGRFVAVRTVTTVAALITPVVAGLGTTSGDLSSYSRYATVVLAVLGAAGLALDQILRDGARWRLYRAGSERMLADGWHYFTRQGKYANAGPEERFTAFFASVEATISEREQRYITDIAGIVDQQPSPIRDNGSPGNFGGTP